MWLLIYSREKATLRACFKNSPSIALQGRLNEVNFQRKGSGITLKFSLHFLKSESAL